MITAENLSEVLLKIGFVKEKGKNIFSKNYSVFGCSVKVDFDNKKIIYPVEKGFVVNDTTTCNFEKKENFVVLECVVRLLDKGYRPEHLELERKWSLGHDPKGGKADICVHDKDGKSMLFIVECKQPGKYYKEAYDILLNDGGQLFSYWKQDNSTKWLVLYASDYDGSDITYKNVTIRCTDDANILKFAKKDSSVLTYEKCSTAEQFHEAWRDTYKNEFCGDVVFDKEAQPYNIGLKLLKKRMLKDFAADDKIVNRFEEILRHNNVSDKENAFNRLIALFICKLADEISKDDDDVVDFQYKVGTDTYESLQDRLQKLHQQGMDEFMKEKIFYISDDYAEKIINTYTGQNRKNLINELNNTLRILKFYTNNDFSFKDVHNEELFYQNGMVLVEVVELFQQFRIIDSKSLQLLGDLFEQLLNKGFKQNEGQFFTPIPITRFIWHSLPLDNFVCSGDEIKYPKIIDYACGAGHFLTEGFERVEKIVNDHGKSKTSNWEQTKIYGIEKDYRLARVSKISLFMHGAGNGNIIFGDGLENYPDKGIENNSFDILVANPPYSVAAFKPHLKLKNNKVFEVLPLVTNDGSEIETLFVERISQLVKSNGLAAVVLPSPLLNKESGSYVKAREMILKNFEIKSIVAFGNKTFGATGTNTVVMFLKKFNEPPKRIDEVSDSVESIFDSRTIDDWEDKKIISQYCERIKCLFDIYSEFILKSKPYSYFASDEYLSRYVKEFENSAIYKNTVSRKTYASLSKDKQEEELNTKFFEFAHSIEKDKVLFFGLTYKQRICVVVSPSENAEQEKFLGYKWSNRKGQEGIQTINEGGLLFNPNDENDSSKITYLVRKAYDDLEPTNMVPNDLYFHANLCQLIDFDSFNFNKSIKLTKPKNPVLKPGYKNYKLNDDSVFELSIGRRVLKEELVSDGKIPVISANSSDIFGYINEEILTDYSRDSILWGIDGDWIVDIVEKNKKFFPTDHCGVVRIKNDDILPQYFMYALLYEGNYERFSRTNRASTTAISKLTIAIPDVNVQKSFIGKANAIVVKKNKKSNDIDSFDKKIFDKFNELFNLKDFIETETNSPYKTEPVSILFDDGRGRVIDEKYVNDHKGNYPVYSSQTSNEGIFGYIDTYDFDGEYLTWTTDGAKAGKVFLRNGKFNCTNVCGTLKMKVDYITLEYAWFILSLIATKHVNHVGNDKLMNTEMKKIQIPVPDKDKQLEFSKFVKEILIDKDKAQKELDKIDSEMNSLIEGEFAN